ncbi:unnamed protein product, partial [Hapterophycus canaliculatus]
MEARQTFKKAESIIDKILDIKPNQDRWAIKGSMHKRWAMIEAKTQQLVQLKKMVHAYKSGYEFGIAMKSDSAFYPLQNLVAANIVLAWSVSPKSKDKLSKKQMKSLFTELKSFMQQYTVGDTDFWTMVQKPDFQLLEVLNRGNIGKEEEEDII